MASVDIFLKPIVLKSISYIKDTTDFVNKIEKKGKLGPTAIVGILDVSSLYTNIPNAEGLDKIQSNLNIERPGTQNPSNETLVDLLETVLT